MLDIERQKSNTLKTEVVRLRAGNSKSRDLERAREDVTQLHVRSSESLHCPDNTQSMRGDEHPTHELEWMRMEETQLGMLLLIVLVWVPM